MQEMCHNLCHISDCIMPIGGHAPMRKQSADLDFCKLIRYAYHYGKICKT